MRRLARAVGAAAVGFAVAFGVAAALAAPIGWVAAAHSQLVSSTPGSGEVVAAPPGRLVLVFSEPIDGRHTSLDLLDATGRTIATGLGAPDPSNRAELVATAPALPALGSGAYTVNWRALSAADGHATSGSFSFGVGSVAAGSLPLDVAGTGGDLHAGHDAGQILLEVQGRTLSDAGFMLAFGLLVVLALVLRPAGEETRAAVGWQLGSLAVGGASAIVLGLAAGSTPGLDPVGYLTSTASGALLVDRALVAAAGIALGLVAARLGRRRAAELLAGLAGLAGIVLVGVGGHAAAAPEPVGPVANVVVHVAAASVWLAGVAALAGLAIARGGPDRSWLAAVVPRFSAVALVAVALVVATGAYTAWLETGDLTTIDSQYAIALLAKVALVGVALVLGALNLTGRGLGRAAERNGGAADTRAGGFDRRIVVEAVALVAVLVATANLASGSPPGPERPVPIAAAPSAAAASVGAGSSVAPALAVAPGRPGPNAWWVTLPASAPIDVVELRLDRVDEVGAENVVKLRAVPGQPGRWVATGGVLPPDSRWTATAVASSGGSEVARADFRFALDGSTITDGRGGLPIDPALALAAALVVAGVVGVAFALAGGVLPWVDRIAGRRALVGGGLVGVVLAVALAFGAVVR